LAPHRVQKVSDIVKEGDMVKVKVLEIDRNGKIRLSRKALLEEDHGRGRS
jgi:polyribonucleotide nucleotidyltransferase